MLVLKSKYNVRQDPSDWRDLPYTFARQPLREYVDLRKWASPVESQGHLGSCTGNAVVGAYELLLNKEQPDKFIDLSRLFVYYNARLIENAVNEDVGAYVRDAVKAVQKYGVCSELIWPYHIADYTLTPSIPSYEDASHRNIKNYYRIHTLEDILDALNKEWPVVFSMRVYSQFDDLYYSATTVEMPKAYEEQSPIGAHAMCFVGYDLNKKVLIARNSFGTDWGMQGYCYIPFEYARQEVMDSWIFDIELTQN
jgi:C1A family cysteine protease